ncbi:MAG TPA: DUF4838 domain-containing protein [Draconibacterium sp.]|nr:DUF4838 domain-containing protein [Draconibacterium sp.]
MSQTKSFIILILATLFACTQNNRVTIVKNNQSDYEIVLEENSDSTIQLAADQFQYYLEKISGAKIPITNEIGADINENKLFIGGKNRDALSPHSVIIKNEGKNIIITGGSSQSVLYAVYEFLEKYAGCRWYSPAVEKIPASKTVSVQISLNDIYTPEITTRTVHSRLFYDNRGFADKMKVTHDAFPGYVPTARVHTFNRFLPASNFFKAHPEYYALRNGKRQHTQLCLTNKEVLRLVTDSVAAWFNRYPGSQVISVSQDDNTLNCQCDDCRTIDDEEGSASGTMIRFVNDVAASFPDKTISTLAYQYTRHPSKTKPADNVLITLCSIECDRSAPIEEKCTDFAEDLIGWKEKTEHIRIWDYTTQFTNFLAPFPNIYTLQPNIRFFRDNHATWVFEQHSHHPSELFELRSYLTAKLLWNPDLDKDEIITDFTNGYYEEAGVFVKKYIDLIHQEIQNDSSFFLFLYGDPAQAFNSWLNPELLNQYNTFFNDAEVAVSSKPEVLQRLKTARLSTDYAMLEMARNGMSPDFQLLENGKIAPDVTLRINRFKESCHSAEITLMNEMGYTVDEYLALFENTLQRAAMPNVARNKTVTLHTKPKKYAAEDPQALTDGALGGSNFYANWLGFEGNDMEAVIDLGNEMEIDTISTAFLQVTNHIVFFPVEVTYHFSNDLRSFQKIEKVDNPRPLTNESKRNDIAYFTSAFKPVKARYIKVNAKNMGSAPAWHNAAGSPAWIFADEVIVN